jgi:hypothetical protein
MIFVQTFKDVMLAPGICKEWDWRASGTVVEQWNKSFKRTAKTRY